MATTSNMGKVLATLDAIRARYADGAVRHVDPHFVQHSPSTADGAAGLRQYVDRSPPDELNLTIVRAIEDGPYVLAQLKAAGAGPDLFAVYRLEDGRIAKHWGFPQAVPPRSEWKNNNGML